MCASPLDISCQKETFVPEAEKTNHNMTSICMLYVCLEYVTFAISQFWVSVRYLKALQRPVILSLKNEIQLKQFGQKKKVSFLPCLTAGCTVNGGSSYSHFIHP